MTPPQIQTREGERKIATQQAPDRKTFVSPNGDQLFDLNQKHEKACQRLMSLREELSHAEQALKPLRDEVDRQHGNVMNLSCRLNVWWNAFRNASEPNRKRDLLTMPEVVE